MIDSRVMETEIAKAMQSDQHRLRRRLRALVGEAGSTRGAGKSRTRQLAQLRDDLNRSIARREARRAGAPGVEYDGQLPIHAKRDEIAATIREHQVVVVSGETGSGKSTQLPKICLEMGRGIGGLIGHTQPRRIAARSIAARLAEELGAPLGTHVGFKIRFTDTTSQNTYVKLMTDGILLAETEGDRFLDQYDTIILDEAHERSLNIDFLIGYLKRLLTKRPELKLIITSATIDSGRFSRHFRTRGKPAPVIEVSGRSYPVEIRYRPLAVDNSDADATAEPDLEEAVLRAVDELAHEGTGDVLIFMPTERHIHDTAKALRRHFASAGPGRPPVEILPLYARLTAKEQQKVFSPHRGRRIVIATNVAESSLTVPGVRYVVDPGTARISRYSPRSKTQRLPIEPVSQASADQRAGRCGRVAPGVCIRLFDEADYDSRDRFTSPEILRSNLASVILRTKSLKLGDVERFPFLDRPKPAAIRDGYQTLFELGAIDQRRTLTELGYRLCRMPVDPRIGRMILAAEEEGCLAEVLIIASALEVRDPRERPLDKREQADTAHAQFLGGESDFFAYLKLWDFYHHLKGKLSRNQLRKACRQNFLSHNRMREWLDIHRQLLQLVEQMGLKPRNRRDDYAPIHRAVLAGLLSSVACRTEPYEYTAAENSKAFLWPGSGLFDARPHWIVAAELIETTRRYLRTCARIDPEWIEPLAMHLVKRSYLEPHWSQAGGSAVAYEKVTLFGLTIVPRRRVAYGPIDPKHARELFIQHGLVEGQLDTNAPFFVHNRALAEEARKLQAKLRRHDLLLGEWAQYAFYDDRLPDDVYDNPRLVRWLEEARSKDARVLEMSLADLLDEPVDEAVSDQFPDTAPTAGSRLPLEYRFEPGAEHDGITLVAPLDALNLLDPDQLTWLVPGLLCEKIAALIRSLPKPVRRKLVPAPDTARKVIGQLPFGEGCLLTALASILGRMAAEPISPAAFQLDKLPDDLRMNLRVVDESGNELAAGRNLDAIRRKLAADIAQSISTLDDTPWTRDGLVAWDFDELPRKVEVRRGGLTLQAFPTLVDRGESVSLALVEREDRAFEETRRGLLRLFFLAARRDLDSQVAWLPGIEEMTLHAASIQGFALRRQLAELLADRAFLADRPTPRNRAEFEAQLTAGRRRIVPAVQEVARFARPIFRDWHHARLAWEETTAPRCAYALEDIASQLDHLTGPDFLTATPWAWIGHVPRYFRAVVVRLEKLRSGGLARDRRQFESLGPHLEAYLNRAREHHQRHVLDPNLLRYRWMLEEFRVSLFAQALGTSLPISAKRLNRQWEKVAP